MAAMEPRCDVMHLEDSVWMGWKSLMKLRNLKYCVLSTFLAMVEIFQALRSLWITLFPFALLWWNVMLYATCSKYYSWKCTGLRLLIAESNFQGDDIQDRCSHHKEEHDEESENSLLSSHHRESFADASGTDRIEIGVSSLCQEGIHAQVVCYKQGNGGSSTTQEERKLQLLRHDFDVSTYCRNQLHMMNPRGGMASALPDVPHSSELSMEATSSASDSQALVASSQQHISKLSSLCFLDGVSVFSDSSRWVPSAFLSQHRVPPLAMLDVSRFCQIPVDVNSLTQGKLLDLTSLLLGDGVSADMSFRRARILGSREKNHKVSSLRLLLSSTISDAPSANNVMVSQEVGIYEEPCVENSDCAENHAVDDDDEGLCSAISSSSDGLDDLYEDYSVQSYENDGCCSYDCYDDIGSCVDDLEHVYNVEESSIHSGTSADSVVYEHCLQWDAGYHDCPCVEDAENICIMDCDSEDGNVEDMVASHDGIHRVAENGLRESSVGAREIYVTELDTWWDEGAVLVNNQAREDDSIGEPEWEMV